MRHSIAGIKLNRNISQRQALFKTQLRQLISLGNLKTTETKGKVLVNSIEKLLHKAETDTVHVRRQLFTVLGDTDLVAKTCELSKNLEDKAKGMVKMVRIGTRRGDNTMMVKLELLVKLTEMDQKEEKKVDKKKKLEIKKKDKTKQQTIKIKKDDKK